MSSLVPETTSAPSTDSRTKFNSAASKPSSALPVCAQFAHDRLLMIHNMGEACRYCTLWADGFNGFLPHLEDALSAAFPREDIRRVVSEAGATSVSYQVRFSLPLTLSEARETLHRVRQGLSHLLARFEVERYQSVEGQLRTFGVRQTLARLHQRDARLRSVPVRRSPLSNSVVH